MRAIGTLLSGLATMFGNTARNQRRNPPSLGTAIRMKAARSLEKAIAERRQASVSRNASVQTRQVLRRKVFRNEFLAATQFWPGELRKYRRRIARNVARRRWLQGASVNA